MLDELIAYLRAAMPKMRDTSSTVGQELDLVRAYLGIVRLRLGERLVFDIETPEQIADARMPPMMLLPLVDHAIAHGLERSGAQGTIRITAETVDGRIRVGIVDSGAGFVPQAGGEDIGSIRERLSALYGSHANLVLRRTDASPTEAVLEIPYEALAAPSSM
jgi:LytS/YehU family sensor histidine kinase